MNNPGCYCCNVVPASQPGHVPAAVRTRMGIAMCEPCLKRFMPEQSLAWVNRTTTKEADHGA